MKKQLTPEQIAARDARRARFSEMVKKVSAMSAEQRAEIVPSVGAVVTCEGRTLSPFNTCLAMMQNPGVSMVGGFRQWLRNGRAVQKGQHGMMIWIPLGNRAETATGAEQPATEGESMRFGTATVFDVSQTDAVEIEAGAELVPA